LGPNTHRLTEAVPAALTVGELATVRVVDALGPDLVGELVPAVAGPSRRARR